MASGLTGAQRNDVSRENPSGVDYVALAPTLDSVRHVEVRITSTAWSISWLRWKIVRLDQETLSALRDHQQRLF
jgi:hypothetical protein